MAWGTTVHLAQDLRHSRRVVEVASALGCSHAPDVVHPYLRLENIMFLPPGHALLADFGIVYAIESCSGDVAGHGRLGETGLTLGTPTYMSPEQAAGPARGPAEEDADP